MLEMRQIWVPNSTPLGGKPLMYLYTQPSDPGWKLITVSAQQLNEWATENTNVNNKKILFG